MSTVDVDMSPQPTAPAAALVEIRGVSKHFGEGEARVDALRDVAFRVEAGEVVGLLGPSGSGKSTLLNLIGLLDRPSSGELQISGSATSHLPEAAITRLRGQHIGFVFQQHLLIPAFTALENVMMPLLVERGRPDPQMRQRAAELLAAVGLSDRADYLAGKLSGGQQQRVAIARALAMRPALVLADEPTGNLDT